MVPRGRRIFAKSGSLSPRKANIDDPNLSRQNRSRRSVPPRRNAARRKRLAERDKFNAFARSERPYEKRKNSNTTRRVFCTRQTFLLLPRPAQAQVAG